MPGHGGGGWLQKDWGLEDGSGTRVSVRSLVYVGLTASVSKAARERIKDDTPRGTTGKKVTNEEAETERKLNNALGLQAPARFKFTNVMRTQQPTHQLTRNARRAGQPKTCYWVPPFKSEMSSGKTRVHSLRLYGLRNKTISHLIKSPTLPSSLLFAIKGPF